MNLMNLEEYQFTVADFKAVQVYPFAQKTQRYFTAIHENHAGAIYRIVAYPHKLVQVEPLLATLNRVKELTHPLLARVAHIIPSAQLAQRNEQSEAQKVIAVVIEQVPDSSVLCFFDFIIKIGPLSENLAKDFAHRIVSIVQFMQAEGIEASLTPQDIFIDSKTGQIILDSYGDRHHFKTAKQRLSDGWELGSFIFTCLKTIPPFQFKLNKDPHYHCLVKEEFVKFWSFFPSKPVRNPSQEGKDFINLCFSAGKKMEDLKLHPWLNSSTIVTADDTKEELRRLAQAKQMAIIQRNKDKKIRRQNILNSIREKNNGSLCRSTENDELINHFLQKLCEQQTELRPIYNNQNGRKMPIELAYFLTQLVYSKEKDVVISEIQDFRDMIKFRLKAELQDNIQIDSEVELNLKISKEHIPFQFKRVSGSFYDSLWVQSYLSDLCLEI